MTYQQRGQQWECMLCGEITSSIGRADHHNWHLQQIRRKYGDLGKGSEIPPARPTAS